MSMYELLVIMVVGGLFVSTGLQIWRKEKITLIHDYHYTKVKEEDKKPYTEKMGKAIMIMGLGMCLMGIIDFISSTLYGVIVFSICFVGGLIMIVLTQVKYNHGIF